MFWALSAFLMQRNVIDEKLIDIHGGCLAKFSLCMHKLLSLDAWHFFEKKATISYWKFSWNRWKFSRQRGLDPKSGSVFFLDPDPDSVQKKSCNWIRIRYILKGWMRIRIRYILKGWIWIRIRSISNRIRSPASAYRMLRICRSIGPRKTCRLYLPTYIYTYLLLIFACRNVSDSPGIFYNPHRGASQPEDRWMQQTRNENQLELWNLLWL